MFAMPETIMNVVWIFVVWAVVELMALAIGLVLLHGLRWKGLERPSPNQKASFFEDETALHPYIGYVGVPGTPHHTSLLGFSGDVDHVQRRTNKVLLIAVLGGSVAKALTQISGDVLKTVLSESGCFHDREIRIIPLAMGGYKQPQQLMCLTYLYILGAEFDLVVNLDGFNEVALYPAESRHRKIAPIYPRNWFGKVGHLHGSKLLPLIGEFVYLTDCLAQFQAHNRLIDALPTRRLLLIIKQRRLQSKLNQVRESIRMLECVEADFTLRGPSFGVLSDNGMYSQLAAIWRISSLQLDIICKGNGAVYIHCLQPNQYVRNSKTLSDEEERNAYDPKHPYKAGAERGYPYLFLEEKELQSNLIDYHNLTQIFIDVKESTYCDTCCHLTKLGNDILMKKIGGCIVDAWKNKYFSNNTKL